MFLLFDYVVSLYFLLLIFSFRLSFDNTKKNKKNPKKQNKTKNEQILLNGCCFYLMLENPEDNINFIKDGVPLIFSLFLRII